MEKIFKRLLSLAIVLVMVLSMVPGNALQVYAADTADLTISTAAELAALAEAVNGGETYTGKTVVLAADIDLAGSETNLWTPIGPSGDSANKFRGTFDGQGHTIKNLYVKQDAAYHAAGLFGATCGTVKNLTIDGAYVESLSAGNSDGATVNGTAVLAGSTAYGATIENVHVKNATVKGNRYVAGIVGYMDGSVINCSVENVTIVATPDNLTGSYDNGDKAGGIVGYCNSNSVEVSGCELKGTVNITAYRDVAGIVGCASTGVKVNNNTNSAELTITIDPTLCGERDSYNAGEIIGRNTPAEATGNTRAEGASCNITEAEAAFGTITPGYTRADGVWGEATANASESFYVELYVGETKIATTQLNNIGGIIDGDVYVTWSIPFAGSFDDYWTVIWEEGYPDASQQPTKVVLYSDGKAVAENDVQMNGPDDLNPVAWEEVVKAATMPIQVTYADGSVAYFDDMLEAVPYKTNYDKLEGATVKLLKDVSAPGIRMMENDMVLDLNGKTYTITDGTGSQGTNTSGFQIRPEVTTVATIKNGTIQVAEGAPVVWMFNNYAANFVVEDVTIDCANMAYSYGSSVYTHVSRSGDNTQLLGNTKFINFNSEAAGSAVNVGGTMSIADTVVPGGTIELDAGATLTAAAGLDVITAEGYRVVYENGIYSAEEAPVAVTTLDALKAALAAEKTEIQVTADITVDEALTVPENVTVTVTEGKTLRVLDALTNNGTIDGNGKVTVSVMVYVTEERDNYNVTATKNGAVIGTAPVCAVGYEISLDGGSTWIADTTNGKAQAVLVKTDGTKIVYSSFKTAYQAARTDEVVHMLEDAHVQSTHTSKNYGPLWSYYGLILEGNGHTIFTDLESSGASNEYATIKFTSYLAGTGPKVNPVLKNVTIDSQKNAKADLDFVSNQVTFTVTMYNVNLLGNCQYASFAMKSPSMIVNKSNVEIYDCTIPSWDAGYAKAINLYSGEYALSLNSKCTVYGGTYTKDVSAYCAEGYTVVQNADGKYDVVVDPAYGKVAKIGDTYYATLAEAITAATDGDTVFIIASGTYKLPGFSKELTVKASEGIDVTIDNGGALALNGAKVTFENLIFDYYPNVNYTGLQHVDTVTYNNCTINGQIFLYGNTETFNSCTFNQNSADAYNVWTYGAKNVVFNSCTFNSAGKSVLVYNEGATGTALTAEGCAFIASVPVEGKAAIEIDSSLLKNHDVHTIVVKDSTATGFAAGSVSGNTLWNDKKDLTNLTVTVDNVKVWPLDPAGDMTYTAYGFGTSGEGEKYRENFMIDLYEVYAKESLVVELYANDTLLATSALRETDRDDETAAIARPIKGTKTVNVVVAGRLAGSWDTEWKVAPSVDYIPDTVKVYADGVLVDTYEDAFAAEDAADYAALPGVYKAASVTAADGTVRYYGTLQAAIDAADPGETVTVLTDITLTAKDVAYDYDGSTVKYGHIYVAADKDITLDLNGHTVANENISGEVRYDVLVNKGKLALTDSAQTKGALASNNARDKLSVLSAGSETNWVGYSGGFAVVNLGTMTITDAVIDGNNGSYAVISQGADTAMTLNNATVTGRGALAAHSGTAMVVNGGAYTIDVITKNARDNVLYATGSGTTVTINGGSFDGTQKPLGSDSSVTTHYNKGSSAIMAQSSAEVIVNGGVFAASEASAYAYSGNITLNGGAFANKLVERAGYNVTVFGGIFTEDPDAFCATGYKATVNTDAATLEAYPYATTVNELIVAWNVNTGVEYEDLSAALAEASVGDTIQLLQDVQTKAMLNILGILDLNGHKLTAESYVMAVLTGTGIIDSSADKSGMLVTDISNLKMLDTKPALPIQTDTSCFRFVEVELYQMYSTKNSRFQFWFTSVDQLLLDAANASSMADVNVRFEIELKWDGGSQKFFLDAENTAKYMENWSEGLLYLKLTNPEAVTNLTYCARIVFAAETAAEVVISTGDQTAHVYGS